MQVRKMSENAWVEPCVSQCLTLTSLVDTSATRLVRLGSRNSIFGPCTHRHAQRNDRNTTIERRWHTKTQVSMLYRLSRAPRYLVSGNGLGGAECTAYLVKLDLAENGARLTDLLGQGPRVDAVQSRHIVLLQPLAQRLDTVPVRVVLQATIPSHNQPLEPFAPHPRLTCARY